MISIPVPPGGKGGIFNRVDQSRNDFAEECARLAKGAEFNDRQEPWGCNADLSFAALPA